jgi:hypothetical protein
MSMVNPVGSGVRIRGKGQHRPICRVTSVKLVENADGLEVAKRRVASDGRFGMTEKANRLKSPVSPLGYGMPP